MKLSATSFTDGSQALKTRLAVEPKFTKTNNLDENSLAALRRGNTVWESTTVER
jgi:hypothetical protein